MKHSVKLLSIVIMLIALTSAQRSIAQKGDVQNIKLPFTKEMEDKVIAVVQPVKEKIEQLFKEDQSGNYTAYAEEVRKLKQMKSLDEQKSAIQQIQKKYYSFIKKTWDQAKIDENDYQQKLKNIFPPEMRETIRFTEFLNFSVSGNQKPAPPPPPPPAPSKICVDASNTFFTTERTTKYVNSNESVMISNHFGTVSTGAAVAGYVNASGWILSNITIPGTFPSDNKLLRITKSYEWWAYATAFSVIGCAFATTSTSTENLTTDVFIRCWAPVTWFSTIEKNEVRTVQTLVNKRFMMNIRFGVNVYADSYGALAAGGVGGSSFNNLMWSVCEE